MLFCQSWTHFCTILHPDPEINIQCIPANEYWNIYSSSLITFENQDNKYREPRWFKRGVKEVIYIRINQLTLNKDGADTSSQILMTQFWCHYQGSPTRGNWVILQLKVAVRTTENSRYANSLCCDQKANFIHFYLLPTQMNFHSNKCYHRYKQIKLFCFSVVYEGS